jgi:hypothetical protein
MSDTLAELPHFLQDLFTDSPEALDAQARCDGDPAAPPFCRRRRAVTPSSFARALVFGWRDHPRASIAPLAHYAGCLGPPLSESGLRQHLNPRGAALLRDLLDHALQPLFLGQPSALPLLRRFAGVYLFDSTVLSLPAGLARDYAGCGNQSQPHAAVKRLLGLELTCGGLIQVDFFSARDPDQALTPQAQPLPEGALRYADLGFFSLDFFREQAAQGVFGFTRAHPQRVVQRGAQPAQSLGAFLRGRGPQVDVAAVTVGTKDRLRCRLIAWRVPDAVAQGRQRKLQESYRRRERRRRHKRERGQKGGPGRRRGAGRRRRLPVTAEQLRWCEWVVVLTNVPAEKLSVAEAQALLRARWQIELLIKLWKQSGCLEGIRGQKRGRVECELLAKVLGQVVAHGSVLASGRVYLEVSAPQAAELVRKYAERLGQALGQGLPALLGVWEELLGRLQRVGRRRRGRLRPSTEQRLAGTPQFWEYEDAA